jgi:hypothetical protein
MVKSTRDFRPAESWTFPKVQLDKFELMSNSGGSWGADGFLYLTGHDPAELYRARVLHSSICLTELNGRPIDMIAKEVVHSEGQRFQTLKTAFALLGLP